VIPIANPRLRSNQLEIRVWFGIQATLVTPIAVIRLNAYICHSESIRLRSRKPLAISSPPMLITRRAPQRSIHLPTSGERSAPTRAPMEIAAEMAARLQPNSRSSAGRKTGGV
jgi:hypothetical protein